MARRYTRREFVTDAAFMFGCSVLLKVVAPQSSESQSQAAAQTATAIVPPTMAANEPKPEAKS